MALASVPVLEDFHPSWCPDAIGEWKAAGGIIRLEVDAPEHWSAREVLHGLEVISIFILDQPESDQSGANAADLSAQPLSEKLN